MIDINNPLKGKMNGYEFSVKPKSLVARRVQKELQEDMAEWQEKNNTEYIKWSRENSEAIEEAVKDKNFAADVFLDAPESKDWLDDVEFRSERFKKMADASMSFKKPVPDKMWESDELEYGVIELAWDFFTGKQEMPKNMLIA